jgi:hypothetical protein
MNDVFTPEPVTVTPLSEAELFVAAPLVDVALALPAAVVALALPAAVVALALAAVAFLALVAFELAAGHMFKSTTALPLRSRSVGIGF